MKSEILLLPFRIFTLIFVSLQSIMKILRWGFIGCGEVTEKKSGPAFSEIEGSSVVAVMSRQERKARSYAERHGIPKWYTDAQELIDDPDVNAAVMLPLPLWP